MLDCQPMKGTTTTAASLSAVLAVAVGIWQLEPAIDGIFFSESEAADFSEVARRRHYTTQIDVLELRQKHAITSEEIAMIQDEIDYYRGKIRELNEGANP